jgi:hypothetical protein
MFSVFHTHTSTRALPQRRQEHRTLGSGGIVPSSSVPAGDVDVSNAAGVYQFLLLILSGKRIVSWVLYFSAGRSIHDELGYRIVIEIGKRSSSHVHSVGGAGPHRSLAMEMK